MAPHDREKNFADSFKNNYYEHKEKEKKNIDNFIFEKKQEQFE